MAAQVLCVCYVSGLSLIVAGTIPLPIRGNYRVVPPQCTSISTGITRPRHISLYSCHRMATLRKRSPMDVGLFESEDEDDSGVHLERWSWPERR
jgi:hypothetical protein